MLSLSDMHPVLLRFVILVHLIPAGLPEKESPLRAVPLRVYFPAYLFPLYNTKNRINRG